MYKVILKRGEERRVLSGHPWIYANEVSSIEGKDRQGSIAEVVDSLGKTVGYGYINHASKILVRMLSRTPIEDEKEFFTQRIRGAKLRRESIGYSDNYRAVFGESDLLPALIVDKYGDYLSVQLLSLGMDARREMLTGILKEVFAPRGIYERSDVPVRLKEGLEERKGLLFGEVPDRVEITENGLKLSVDIPGGQKTGYFLDQKANRAAIKPYVKGLTVLDCFSNAGGFALNAAAAGAAAVTAVDISESACALIEDNAALNGFGNVEAVRADVFGYLKEAVRAGRKFGSVVLDPPAFTKSADTVKEAARAYRQINAEAMKLVADGGYLFTFSCSQHFTLPSFLDTLREAAAIAGRAAQLVEIRAQASDHATLLASEETLYLKGAFVRVLEKL